MNANAVVSTPTRGTAWPRTIEVTSIVGALTAVGAGLAYYSGWSYERAYAAEWGVSFTALRYDPFQLMTASDGTLGFALILPLLWLGYFGVYRALFEQRSPTKHVRRLVTIAVMILGLFLTLLSFLFLELGRGAAGVLALLPGLLLVGMGMHVDDTHPNATASLAGVAFGVFLAVVVLTPVEFGQRDAQRDRDDTTRLPLVQLVATRALGLDGEHKEGDLFLTGPVRLIFVNNDNLWVTSISGGVDAFVYQVAERDIRSVRYINRSSRNAATPTLTPAAQ